MRVLIVSLFTSWETHLGEALEIAQRHLDEGDTVEILECDGAVRTCVANHLGQLSKCDRCRLRRDAGLKLLDRPVIRHRMGDYFPRGWAEIERDIEARVTDASSAEAYTFAGHDLGAGALSSAIWRARDPLVETTAARRRLVAYTKGAVRSYLITKAFLAERGPYEKAYVFNGRFGCTRGVFRACREVAAMETLTHERGSSPDKLGLFSNSMPHGRELWRREIARAWSEAPDAGERDRIARAFYEERRGGVAVVWKSFTAGQRADLLPEGFDPKRKNVIIFNSSEDEFVGLGEEWKNPVYPMQSRGVERIVVDALEKHPSLHFYLRMHPNLTGVRNRDVAALRALAARGLPNFTLIEPDSKISSYALLDASDRIISFGSTMGVEGTYWGKVSLMAGRAFYQGLDAVYEVRDHDDLLDLLGRQLAPKPVLGALQYSHFARTHGSPFRYWRAEGFHAGTYRGQSLRLEPRLWPVRRIKAWWMDVTHAWARRRAA